MLQIIFSRVRGLHLGFLVENVYHHFISDSDSQYGRLGSDSEYILDYFSKDYSEIDSDTEPAKDFHECHI